MWGILFCYCYWESTGVCWLIHCLSSVCHGVCAIWVITPFSLLHLRFTHRSLDQPHCLNSHWCVARVCVFCNCAGISIKEQWLCSQQDLGEETSSHYCSPGGRHTHTHTHTPPSPNSHTLSPIPHYVVYCAGCRRGHGGPVKEPFRGTGSCSPNEAVRDGRQEASKATLVDPHSVPVSGVCLRLNKHNHCLARNVYQGESKPCSICSLHDNDRATRGLHRFTFTHSQRERERRTHRLCWKGMQVWVWVIMTGLESKLQCSYRWMTRLIDYWIVVKKGVD